MLRAKLGLTRSNQVTEMLRTSVPLCVVAVFLIIAVTGCEKKQWRSSRNCEGAYRRRAANCRNAERAIRAQSG